MMAEDTEVWTEYLKNPITPISEVWYDLHVGGPVAAAGGPESLEGRVVAGVTRKRIDVVAHVGAGYWVIEIKPIGSALALGQALSYARMFADEYSPAGEVVPVVICHHCDADLVYDFEAAGVSVIETGPPG